MLKLSKGNLSSPKSQVLNGRDTMVLVKEAVKKVENPTKME